MKKYQIIYADPPWRYNDPKGNNPAMGGITYPTMSDREIYDLISNDQIGKIQHVHGKYGNGLMNNGSHLINLMLWYLGPAKWAIGFSGNVDKKDDLK